MDEFDAKLAAFIAGADQMIATFKSIADAHATFYKELVEKGLNEEQAIVLTNTNLVAFWQYLAVSHNTPDAEGSDN